MRCPWCGSANVDAEFVDIGVGFQQVTPYRCGDCDALQLGPDSDNATDIERRVAWYAPQQPLPFDLCPGVALMKADLERAREATRMAETEMAARKEEDRKRDEELTRLKARLAELGDRPTGLVALLEVD